MKVHVIINGFPRSGKNTFVDFCKEYLKNENIETRDISSVDVVKKCALELGWDGEKDFKGRRFLSELKDLSSSNYDGPLKYMIKTGTPGFDYVSFYHVREPQEIDRLKKELSDLNFLVYTLLIRRSEVENEVQSNHADSEVLNYSYDYECYNNRDIEHFKKLAESFSNAMILV